MQVNRKRYQFWTIYCLYSFRGDLLEKWWAKPQPKRGKSPLKVDLRRSKTSLLQIFSIFKRHARSTSSVGKRISVKWLYHRTEFKQKLIKWSIICVLQYMAIIFNYRFSSNISRGNYFFFRKKRGRDYSSREGDYSMEAIISNIAHWKSYPKYFVLFSL